MNAEYDASFSSMKLRNRIAGCVMVVLGLGVVVESLSYNLGTASRMGPGYLPLALGVLIIPAGGFVALVAHDGDAQPSRIVWRPAVLVLSAILAFALLVEPVGLAAATAAIVFIAGAADPTHNWKSLAALYAVLLSAVYVIFGLALGVPFHLISGVI